MFWLKPTMFVLFTKDGFEGLQLAKVTTTTAPLHRLLDYAQQVVEQTLSCALAI